jgi:hypothetical protein
VDWSQSAAQIGEDKTRQEPNKNLSEIDGGTKIFQKYGRKK